MWLEMIDDWRNSSCDKEFWKVPRSAVGPERDSRRCQEYDESWPKDKKQRREEDGDVKAFCGLKRKGIGGDPIGRFQRIRIVADMSTRGAD